MRQDYRIKISSVQKKNGKQFVMEISIESTVKFAIKGVDIKIKKNTEIMKNYAYC